MKYSFLALCLSLLFVACKTEGDTNSVDLSNYDTSNRGYKYKLFEQGKGDLPSVGDEIYFDYIVALPDTQLYDSRNQPMPPRFRLPELSQIDAKASPMLDVLPLMREGDSLIIYTPIDSAMKAQDIFKNEENLIYRLAMNFILKDDPTSIDRESDVADLVEKSRSDFKNNNGEMTDLGNGLKMIVHEQGSGDNLNRGERVVAHYYGVLASNGTEFDNSFKKGRPFTFKAGRGEVIRGWDEAMMTMSKGSKASIFIPSDLGYGSRNNGSIPADSDLVFYVEIVE